MNKFSLPVISCLCLAALSAQAANITFVSFHSADETPTANAANAGFTNAPDAGYTALLRAAGHTVTRYVTTAAPDTNLLNTADLVVVGRSVPSGHYQTEPSPTDWNGVTAPMIVLNGYLTRGGTGGGSRLGLTTGETMADMNTVNMRLRVNAPQHPIFNGIALDTNNVMVNPFLTRMTHTNAITGATTNQLGVSLNTSAFHPAGSVLAVVGSGSASVNSMVIGELPAGEQSRNGVPSVFGAKRLAFFSGSRESGITSEGAGIMDLLPDGRQIFLNAVNYLLNKTAPATASIGSVGVLTNLYPGDWLTINGFSSGADPRTNQWYFNNQPLADATNVNYALTNFSSANVGDYFLVVGNAFGSATSSVLRLEAAVLPAASITNGMIAYWPLNDVVGTKTPDLVSGYDMSLVNMGATNIVQGRWGNAFQFDGASSSSMERLHNPGEDLPVYKNPNFTVSLWVNGGTQSDKRVFCEGNTTNNTPMFSLGTHNANPPPDGSFDIYIRNDGGTIVGDHRHTTLAAYDYAWHNVVYIQRDIGGGMMKGQIYIDGVLDSVQITPVRPLSANATAIGAVRRAASSAWFTGTIDEVACWNRALTPQEIQILQVTSITNPPSRVQPLTISKFTSDVSAVASGTSTTLRWEVSKDASSVSITPLGDVTAETSVGVGSRSITLIQPITYVLTVQRGTDSLSATTRVAVVEGVAPGWALLDNFDQYTAPGNLFSFGYWNDVSGNSVDVVSLGDNPAVKPKAGIAFMNLRNLSIQENQGRTLFFRIIPGPNNPGTATNIVGLTDKTQRDYADAFRNIGPVLYATTMTNSAWGIETNAWYLGARNGWIGNNTSNDPDYPANPLEAGAVYNVWIDVTNKPIAEYASDSFTVYIQKEGGAPRTVLFNEYTSDRDLSYNDPVLGSIAPVLDKLVLVHHNNTVGATFDDFYLSTGGLNATVPRAYGYTGPQRSTTVKATWVGNQLSIQFTGGVLQQATTPNGEWTDVTGNPASPYLVTPTGSSMFFRTR